jgi:hypothetical protein
MKDHDEKPYVISLTRNEALFLDDSMTLMVENTPEAQNVRPLRPISPVTSGGVPAPMELIHKIGKAVLYTCDLENKNKEYKIFLEEFELLLLREVCWTHAKFGADLVGFSLKQKIYKALLADDLRMEQHINQVIFNMDKEFSDSDNPKQIENNKTIKINIKSVDDLLRQINEEYNLDEKDIS